METLHHSAGSEDQSASDGDFGALFSGLEGEWLLEREISDGAHFKGMARFSAVSGSELLLIESGQLLLPNKEPLNAAREWQWIRLSQDSLDIRYPSVRGGERYHLVKLVPASASGVAYWRGKAHHKCGDDLYVGDYRLAENRLDIAHQINGPKKDLTINSRFIRHEG